MGHYTVIALLTALPIIVLALAIAAGISVGRLINKQMRRQPEWRVWRGQANQLPRRSQRRVRRIAEGAKTADSAYWANLTLTYIDARRAVLTHPGRGEETRRWIFGMSGIVDFAGGIIVIVSSRFSEDGPAPTLLLVGGAAMIFGSIGISLRCLLQPHLNKRLLRRLDRARDLNQQVVSEEM